MFRALDVVQRKLDLLVLFIYANTRLTRLFDPRAVLKNLSKPVLRFNRSKPKIYRHVFIVNSMNERNSLRVTY